LGDWLYIFSTIMRLTGPQISRMLLASLFLVFNVGLPILIDSCPMPKPVGTMMCPLCHGHGGEGSGEVVKGKPCCSPSLAAGGNTNEFLRIQKNVSDRLASLCVIFQSGVIPLSSSSVSQISASTPSQFAPDDIPVIHSSLLI
jgi:hypothetical protein